MKTPWGEPLAFAPKTRRPPTAGGERVWTYQYDVDPAYIAYQQAKELFARMAQTRSANG